MAVRLDRLQFFGNDSATRSRTRRHASNTVDLADVTHSDWAELQKEVTVLPAPEERREEIAKAINWRKRSLRA